MSVSTIAPASQITNDREGGFVGATGFATGFTRGALLALGLFALRGVSIDSRSSYLP